MKILIVNTRHYPGGGDSTYTFNLANVLRGQAHQVGFLAMQDERNLPDPNADLFVRHVDFKELNRRKNVVNGLQVLSRVIYSREARRSFRQVVDRFQPDIVHLQNIHAHITPSVIFEAKRQGLPVVWTLHDYKLVCPNTHYLIDATGEVCEDCGSGKYYRAAQRRCKKGSLLASGMAALEAYAHRLMRVGDKVDAFLTPSAFLGSKLVEYGFPPAKVHHLPLFLPPDMFQAGEGAVSDDYLLFLGRLELIKGIRPLLDACRLAPEVKLILAGRAEEPLASALPELLPPNARYVGMKHGEELRGLLRGALALVLPSVWYENQPFSILEAFACGKPVIASKLGGMIELVANRERGLLVPPGDVNALAEAMTWMTKHRDEARAMGDSSRAYAARTHSAEHHLAGLFRVYDTVQRANDTSR